MRRDSNRKKIDLANQSFDEKRKQCTSTEKPYVLSEFNIQKPRFTSIKQRIENERQEARKKVNLTSVIQDQKDEAKAPTLAYIEKPKITAMTELQ